MKLRVAVAVALALIALAAACRSGTNPDPSNPIAKGKAAPGFVLPSASGEQVALSDFVGHRPVLLYFSMGPG
jgi:cytochrome oxidase Cu insertion factor (SCO1/SenC/PrrC family)